VSKKTVLVVEDNPGDRAIYGNMLWYNGFDVVFAEDGEAGIRLAREAGPDLILLDLQLPLLHGSELASQLKQDDATKKIPIVALTARRLSEFGGNAALLGYARFLEKPVSPLEVLRVVESLIGRAAIDQAQDARRPETFRARHEEEVKSHQETRVAASPEIQAIATDVRENAAHVLEEWEKLVREEPWFSLPREDRLGFLEEVVASLTEAALVPTDADACRKTVIGAAAHGRSRRGQNIPESAIPIEFHLLRRAIWRHLTQKFAPSEALHHAIAALDSSISLSLNACMWGYFRDEIEAQGLWETAVERLVQSACEAAERKELATG
jgi:two-component system, cell cycle response regulator DivK